MEALDYKTCLRVAKLLAFGWFMTKEQENEGIHVSLSIKLIARDPTFFQLEGQHRVLLHYQWNHLLIKDKWRCTSVDSSLVGKWNH